jgi:hypothetical protein
MSSPAKEIDRLESELALPVHQSGDFAGVCVCHAKRLLTLHSGEHLSLFVSSRLTERSVGRATVTQNSLCEDSEAVDLLTESFDGVEKVLWKEERSK